MNGAQSSFRFCADSVETKPKLISFGISASAGSTTTPSVMDAKNRLSHMESLRRSGAVFVMREQRNVIGQRQDLVGLGAVELAQQRRREAGRGSVVDHAAGVQSDRARAVLERDIYLVKRHHHGA